MKKFNIKKIAMMGLAVMMAVSSMSVSSFAADTGNCVFAEIEDSEGNISYIYESDLVDGSYTIETDNEVIIMGMDDALIKPDFLNVSSIAADTGTFNRTSAPTNIATVTNLALSFNVPASTTRYSPYAYYSSTGHLSFSFQATSGYNYSLRGCVFNNGTTYRMNLYDTSSHYISLYSLSSSNTAYAYVANSTSSAATGTCNIYQ